MSIIKRYTGHIHDGADSSAVDHNDLLNKGSLSHDVLDKTSGMDVVGGRLDLVSATSIKWGFQNSNHIRLFNPTSEQWELVQVTTEPTIANTALDLNDTALAPNTIYDVFAEYDSSTAFDLVLSRWATGGDGANNSSTSYATPVMTGYAEPGPWGIGNDNESGSPAYKAFTQGASAADYWGATSSIGTGHYIILSCGGGNSICINKYAFRSRNTGYNSNCCPSSFKLQASNNASSWVDLESLHTGVTAPGANSWLPSASTYYTVNNTQSYKYYRLLVTANVSGDETNIGELKLVASSNSLAGSSSRVSAYESTVTYAIGDRVTYGGHDWVCIQSGTGQTPSAGAYWVDNGTSVSGDFAGLYRHNGVLVSDSSTTGKSRRWLGIIYTYNNSGTVNFKDEDIFRYISNFYNTKKVPARTSSKTSSVHTFTATGVVRESSNGISIIRANMVSCVTQSFIADLQYYIKNDTSGPLVFIAIFKNSLNYFDTLPYDLNGGVATLTAGSFYSLFCSSRFTAIGYNNVSYIDYATGGTSEGNQNRSRVEFELMQ